MSVEAAINKVIKALGKISVQDFVEISNFNKETGFYNIQKENKIGPKGHFITSPEISSIFSISIFNQFIHLNPNVNKVHLLELGPGNGYLTSDILQEMNQNDVEVISTTFLERSAYFKNKLRENKNFKNSTTISNIDEFEIKDENLVFIYSNEFFDTFGHKQYVYKDNRFNEIFITKKGDEYCLTKKQSLQSDYIEKEYNFLNFKEGDIIEHSAFVDHFIKNLIDQVKKFCFITNDYGYTEYSKKSTLRALSKHKKIDLFEVFENVDYSFSIDFNRMKFLFNPYESKIMLQSDFINNFCNSDFINSENKTLRTITKLLAGLNEDEMGRVFKNFSVQKL